MDSLASHCRYCRFYTPEGRRGGHCGQLGVNVSGSWQSCDLSMAPFAPSWESPEIFPAIGRRKPLAETVRFPDPHVSVKCSTRFSNADAVENVPANNTKQISVSQRVTADVSIYS